MDFCIKKLPENPRKSANFLSVLFFWWVNDFFRLGHKKHLEVNDVYQALPEDHASELGERLQRNWDEEVLRTSNSSDRKKKPSLLKALWRTFGWRYMLYGSFALIQECFLRVVQPICLGRLLRYFNPESLMEPWEAYLYALCVTLGSALYTFTYHPYFFGVQHVGMKMRVACSTLVYSKCLKLSNSALGQTTIGQMVNLLSNDVSRFDLSVMYVHYLWVGPIQAIIILGVLWSELGPSCLAGLAVLIFFVPFQGWLGKIFSGLRLKTAKRTDERIRVMNEIISGIRVIKMYTWENPFAELIQKLRKEEVNIIRKTAYYTALNMTLYNVSSKFIVFITFIIYVLSGNPITSEKVFVTLTLYHNVRLVMTLFFPCGVAQAAETTVSIRRLQDFLVLEEKTSSQSFERPPIRECGVWVNGLTAKWSNNSEEIALENMTCRVGPGQILAVIGPVGSGKSSLLQAVLGELVTVSGSVKTRGKVAYASQQPWVFWGTVQENILCGQPYDQQRYKKIVKVCALEKDLALFPHGDQTYVGERGVSLSGGQKARVNLARALYLDADIYLLDDPLSAVDTHVGRHLFEQTIVSFLSNKIRILVTHQLQYLKDASCIVVLKDGHIEAKGTFDELMKSGVDFASLLKEEENEETEAEVAQRTVRSPSLMEVELEAPVSHQTGRRLSSARKSIDVPAVQPLVEETSSTNAVSGKVYKDYFFAGSGFMFTFFLFLTNLLTQAMYSGADFWLSIWTNREESHIFDLHLKGNGSYEHRPVIMYEKLNGNSTHEKHWWDSLDRFSSIYVYTAWIVALLLCSLCATILFFLACMKASVQLHNRMFHSLTQAPVSFFDANPVGRTLNRFSKDIGIMDEILPVTFYEFFSIALNIVGIAAIVAIVNPWILLPFVVLATIFHLLRSFYLDTARNLKRVEGIARSPVFSHLSTSLNGLTTIRAHKAESIFQRRFENFQDVHSSACYMIIAATHWFGSWLAWISVSYLATVTFACVGLQGNLTSSMAGLAISSAVAATGAFQWAVRQSAETENLMTSVERVLEYTKLPREQKADPINAKPLDNWPSRGQITFKNMYLMYSNDASPVLKDITCTIYPTEKIGIVGRTGAGKSSLIAALFRLTEPLGSIQIDCIETKTVALQDLRSRIAIIPQDPVLFTGTLRYNLDPFSKFTDEQLWDVIEEVKLKEAISELSTGLDTEVSEGGSNFSVGQRQLICLARAILRKNKILVLDEATANVDPKTDSLIQETIRKKFVNCTVLTIAHRLNTIMDSTRIMVLDSGYLKEFGTPIALLNNTSSLFYSLVQQTGKSNAYLLKAIAEEAAQER